MTSSMLDRSKSALLTIHANLTPDYLCQSGRSSNKVFKRVRHALSHAPRIREITLQSRSCIDFSRLIKDFPTSLPNLESFTLKAVTHENQAAFDVPQELFKHDTLPLHQLDLQCCSIPESLLNVLPSHCSVLTRLELHHVAPLTRQGILRIVEAAAGSIEILVLDHVSSFTSPFTGPEHGVALSLPRLSSLHLRGRAEITFCLLRSFTIPSDSRLRLEFCLSVLTPAFRYSPLAKHSSSGSPVRSLLFHHAPQQLCEPYDRGLRLLGYTETATPEYYYAEPEDAKVDIHFSCWEDLERHILTDTLLKLWRAVVNNGKEVHAVTIARISCISTAVWSQLLRNVPEVRELCIHGSPALRALCAVLGAYTPAIGDATPSTPTSSMLSLPSLQTLTVCEGAFRSFPSHRMGSGTRGVDFEALMTCLEARKNAGKRLEKLVVCYSDASRSDMEELGTMVDRLVWDGSLFGRDSIPIPDITPKDVDDRE
ncbi:hypothetical protein DENSPDRAFT_325545 [Dentipellis sp. KUC8613]|nr:hypothetical protein DENSPDRAFT_325545 [Dentipellis sp. KUC8613]